jgi:hypothetical protein
MTSRESLSNVDPFWNGTARPRRSVSGGAGGDAGHLELDDGARIAPDVRGPFAGNDDCHD